MGEHCVQKQYIAVMVDISQMSRLVSGDCAISTRRR